jgi:hypothetical protein
MTRSFLAHFELPEAAYAVECLLDQALVAYEHGRDRKMLWLAELARKVAQRCGDSEGESCSVLLAGVSLALLGRRGEAAERLGRAARTLHDSSRYSQQKHEALALLALGAVLERQNPRDLAEPLVCFQRALGILEALWDSTRMKGDWQEQQRLADLYADAQTAIDICLSRTAEPVILDTASDVIRSRQGRDGWVDREARVLVT